MMSILKELSEEKLKEDLNDNDRKKLSMIRAIIREPNWCNKVDLVTALDYMTFLGLPLDDALDFYMARHGNKLSDRELDQLTDRIFVNGAESLRISVYQYTTGFVCSQGNLIYARDMVRFTIRFADGMGPTIKKEYENCDGSFVITDDFNLQDEYTKEKIRLQICSTGKILTSNKNRVVIGRKTEERVIKKCDVQIDSQEVSRNHAEISIALNGTFWLKDLNSTNGTYIDDKKIPGMEEIEIQPGTIFKVADVKLKLLSDDENKDDTDKPSEKSSAVLTVSDNNDVLTDFETDTDEKKEAKQRRLTSESISDPVKGNGRLKSIFKKVLAYVSKERNTSVEETLQEFENAGKKENIDTDSLHKTTRSERPGAQKVGADKSKLDQKLQTISSVIIPNKGHDECYVPGWMNIIAISVCENYAIGLKKDGTVAAEGYYSWEQCNESDWTDVIAISAGDSHTVGLKKDGTVVAKGPNYWGECNVSDWTDIASISAGGGFTIGLKKDGTVVATGSNYWGECNVSDWTDIASISAGYNHTVGLKKDGTVVATGKNDEGQCYVSDWTDIIAISAGTYHTVALKKDGTVVARGNNISGQCNISDWKDITAISAGYYHTVGLKKDGTVVTEGTNYYRQCNVSGWTDIIAISAGSFHTFGLKKDGTVVKAGDVGYAQTHLLV